jgi:hypothetical protein
MDSSIALKSAGRDVEAMALLQSNRGKTLMDEINVFLYGAILIADENARSTAQNSNAMHRCCAGYRRAPPWSSSWWCSWWPSPSTATAGSETGARRSAGPSI